MLPGLADNSWNYNTTSYNQSITTAPNGDIYATWVDQNRHPIVGKYAGGVWSTFDFTTLGGLMGATVPNDAHNVVNLELDADGYIHVSGNMHGDWLRYARSVNPYDITAWANQTMLRSGSKSGTDEGLVSYPRFPVNPVNNRLFFFYRNGGSGNGDTYLNRYATTGQTWERVAKLIDGTSTNESGYENRPVIDADGVFHLSFTWAAGGTGFNDRTDVCYMRSHDEGVTWEDIHGNPVALPVTHPTAPLILDTTPSNNGLINQTGMDVDDQGRPHIAMLYADENGQRNVYHLWWTGAAWQLDKVTSFTASALSFETMAARPDMVCWGGRSFVIWRHQYEGHRGFVWMSEVTGGKVETFPIAWMDLRDWAPTHDERALRERNELWMLVTRVNNEANAPRAGYESEDWTKQNIGLLRIDMTRIDRLKNGLSELPRLPRP